MTDRWERGGSVPLPDDAAEMLDDLVAGRSTLLRVDTADVGWINGGRADSPLLAIRPGATATSVTLSVTWGLPAVPSPEVFLAIVNGHLSIDARQLPAGTRTGLEKWVQDFNQELSANQRELSFFAVTGTVLEVSARAVQRGTFAQFAPAAALGLAATAAAVAANWPKPSGDATPVGPPADPQTGGGGSGAMSPPHKPTVILVSLIFICAISGLAIAQWTAVGDDPMSSPDVTSDSTAPPTNRAPGTTTPPSEPPAETTTPPTDSPVTATPETVTTSGPPSTLEPPRDECNDGYPPQPCAGAPSNQLPDQSPSVGGSSDEPGSGSDDDESDYSGAIPTTGSAAANTLYLALGTLVIGLLTVVGTRRRDPGSV
ncbi:MAG: hypothetical protein ACR2OH_13125 [Microthrixaceae bacterium]